MTNRWSSMRLKLATCTLVVLTLAGAAPAFASAYATYMAEGRIAYDEGNYRHARKQYELAKNYAGKHLSEKEVSAASRRLAQVLYMQGYLQDAATGYAEVAAVDKHFYGEDSIEVCEDLDMEMRALRRLKRWTEAEALLKTVLEIRTRVYGATHKHVANTWLDLAVNYDRMNNAPEAERCYLQSIAIREQLFGNSNRQLLTILDQYSGMLKRYGRLADAQAITERADKIREQSQALPNLAP